MVRFISNQIVSVRFIPFRCVWNVVVSKGLCNSVIMIRCIPKLKLGSNPSIVVCLFVSRQTNSHVAFKMETPRTSWKLKKQPRHLMSRGVVQYCATDPWTYKSTTTYGVGDTANEKASQRALCYRTSICKHQENCGQTIGLQRLATSNTSLQKATV